MVNKHSIHENHFLGTFKLKGGKVFYLFKVTMFHFGEIDLKIESHESIVSQ